MDLAGGGITTSGICTGGYVDPSVQDIVELWNGSSWSETTDMNQAKSGASTVGADNEAILVFGGHLGPPGNTANTESWNGTSWSETGDLSTGRYGILPAAQGSNTGALAAGGYSTAYIANTEEFTAEAGLATVTVS